MTELSACERARAAYAPTRGNVHEEGNAPVVKIQRRTGQLPVVWVSVPEGEPTLEVTGRSMVGRYPDVLGIFGPDEYGVEATNLGPGTRARVWTSRIPASCPTASTASGRRRR